MNNCIYCGEPIIGTETFIVTADDFLHTDCMIRMIVGSIGHQQKRCSCFGGIECDPPDMTKRQAAVAAADYFRSTC